MRSDERKVVVTGLGLVSPLGCDLELCWKRVVAGESGIRRVQRFDVSPYPSRIAGEVIEFDIDAFMTRKEQRRSDPYCQYAVAAGKLAFADSGLNAGNLDGHCVGVIIGSGIGGLQTFQTQHAILRDRGPDKTSPFTIPQMISNMASGLIAIEYGCKGPNYAVVSACATASHAIGDSMRIVQRGDADIMFAGGSDASICEMGFAGFCQLRALSRRNDEPERASRPFDAQRDGFVIAEGAAVLILEEYEHARKRGARVYCELAGYGATCDAFHETAPLEDGSEAGRAMQIAMKDAGITAGDVDYINAHGTSTSLNDKSETMAIKNALGEEHARRVMVSSTKSMVGHLLGAAGGFESAMCALAIRDGIVPPTINYENPDPECDLDYVPNTAREKKLGAVLNNALGFGGHNATLAFKAM